MISIVNMFLYADAEGAIVHVGGDILIWFGIFKFFLRIVWLRLVTTCFLSLSFKESLVHIETFHAGILSFIPIDWLIVCTTHATILLLIDG